MPQYLLSRQHPSQPGAVSQRPARACRAVQSDSVSNGRLFVASAQYPVGRAICALFHQGVPQASGPAPAQPHPQVRAPLAYGCLTGCAVVDAFLH